MKPLILHIDTALETGMVFLAEGERILEVKKNTEERDHAKWIHGAMTDLLSQQGKKMLKPVAVAVTSGPGSYTGLRVGMATAKGICYAWQLPLITVGVLPLIADAVKSDASDLICPMIDARRMEVFTAIYDRNEKEILSPTAIVVEADSFDKWLFGHKVLFAGNGSTKVQSVIQHANASFTSAGYQPEQMVELALRDWNNQQFADVAYAEPFYVKEFYDTTKRQ